MPLNSVQYLSSWDMIHYHFSSETPAYYLSPISRELSIEDPHLVTSPIHIIVICSCIEVQWLVPISPCFEVENIDSSRETTINHEFFIIVNIHISYCPVYILTSDFLNFLGTFRIPTIINRYILLAHSCI